ncbi:MAG: hypothetical protein F6K45_24705, partial [Kamptonema sp. SIO1D9]|nr:hypothetical protein [Kamptonema sp. SIO1D9]
MFAIGETLRYLVRATDVDADALTYSLSLAPSGAAIDPETGYLVWHPTPEKVGTANLMVKVSDDRGGFELQYFQLEVAYPNRAPVFTSSLPTSQQIQQGKPFTYQARAIDADKDTITYELIDAPDNLTLNPNTGLVSWTPEELGDVEFTLKARDGKGGEALQNLSLSVIEAQPNTTPVIVIDSQPTTGEISINPRSQTRIGNPYLYQLPTTDNDGDPLTYTLTTAPTGMSLSSDSLITWTPTTDQFGAQTVAVEFTDGQGGIGTVGWTINVSHQEVNLAPQILSVPT